MLPSCPPQPSPDEILAIVTRCVTRAKRAGIYEDDGALASMILRELRSEGIRLGRHEFKEGESW